MFVKVLRYSGDYQQETTEMYECSGTTIQTAEDNQLLVRLTGIPHKPGETYTLEIEKSKGNAVYFMNDNGRTIDYYRWEPS